MKPKVLITGATGFIGRYVLEQLKAYEDIELHCTSRSKKNESSTAIWHNVNLLDNEATKEFIHKIRPSHIMHLAWNVEHGTFWTSTDNFTWLDASKKLLSYFKAAGGKRAVIAGSCAQYSWHEEIMKEDSTTLSSESIYGNCKNELLKFCESNLNSDQTSYSFPLIFFVYGPGENRNKLVSSTITNLTNKETIQIRNNNVLDYIYVTDVACALVNLLFNDYSGHINICTGNQHSVTQVVEEIAKQLSSKDLVAELPQHADTRVKGDTSLMKSALTFHPKTTLKDGLRLCIEHLKTTNLLEKDTL